MRKFLDRIHLPNWLCLLLVAVLVLRIPSFFEPYSYGDEMVYLTMGEGIRQGLTLYKDIHDNKPPLLYVVAAISGNLFWFKAILAFWSLATIVLFWKLGKALFPNKPSLQKVSTIIFGILTTIPLLEGNIANAELFMIAPTILGFLILLTKQLSPKNLVFSGVLFSVATLFKVPAAFDIPAIIFLWLIQNGLDKGDLKIIAKRTFYLLVGFVSPIVLTVIWYYLNGAFQEYVVAAFLQNIGYLSSFRPGDIQKPFLERNTPLILRAFLVLVGLVALYVKRKRVSWQFSFLTGWLLLTLFAVTLPERPYPHYLIQSAAPICLLLAILFTEKTKEQSLVIIPLALALFVPVYFQFYHYPTASYYQRFLEFATGRTTKEEYFAKFDSKVNRNYQIADFLVKSTQEGDKIFVWGDSPPIYALTRRFPPIKYVADYHINDFASYKEVLLALSSDNPKFIVILPDAPKFDGLLALLQKNYMLVVGVDNAEVWIRMTAGIRDQIAR